ncbi:MAG: phytanoyl-CoA dioxygenase family protein [Rhodobacteraceae bacterium]|nr:phytanoyl-CoA dioxygenase family protein [Paracoccaceae bacterium]
MKDFGYFEAADCDLAAFAALTGQRLDAAEVPLAAEVVRNVPVYDMPALRGVLADPPRRRALMGEWGHVLGRSAGVLVLRGACADLGAVDAATAIYEGIIAAEKAAGGGGVDHFAKAGANDRIWNSLQKLCLADPEVFARYFGNDAIAAVCEAWLGPGYQMTAQVNLVRPGGAAQTAHRDYHLGFQTGETAARFPAHAHDLSAVMTLQGAVAHCDMPVESGPTKLLPFSQRFGPGYLACRRPEFRDFFEAHCVQLPLARGDALFFNPALFHAAGENRSAGIQRMANLLQVSSAFGRAMEAVDREAMCRRLYPAIRALRAAGRLGAAETEAAIAAAAEGYAFPTNLDTDPPLGGLAPETQAALFRRALAEDWPPARFEAALAAQAARRRA